MGKGFDTFMDNPYWKEIYENAPSDNLKKYFQIRFDHSGFVKDADGHGESEEEKLTEIPLAKADIQYILNFTRNGNARQFYRMFLDKLSGKYEGYSIRASVFQIEEWNPNYRQAAKENEKK